MPTGGQLKFRERAADLLKAAFGTWSLLGFIIGGITGWLLWVHDPGELHLNLMLSFLASVQGVILQIAANRGDKINAAVAMHTLENTTLSRQMLDEIKRQNIQISHQNVQIAHQNAQIHEQTSELTHMQAELNLLREHLLPGEPNPANGTDSAVP